MRCVFSHSAFWGRVACLSIVSATGACGNVGGGPNPFIDAPVSTSSYERGSPNQIVRAEILERGRSHADARSLIRRLRPGWLSPRGQKSLTDPGAAYPLVYIDEIRHGGLGTLYGIPASEIFMMQYFNSADATTRWGTGHPAGVINVVTGR